MNIWVFFILVLFVVLPPWLAFNCHFISPSTSFSSEDPLSSSFVPLPESHPPSSLPPSETKPKKSTVTRETSRFRGTPAYAYVRDVEMVVTSSKYIYHRDLTNKEVTVGGGIVEQPARVDRAGIVKGTVIKRTKAQLKCISSINETLVLFYFWQSDNPGNLHEGMFSLYGALKDIGLLDSPNLRLGFLDPWGPSHQDVLKMVFPKLVEPSISVPSLTEQHPVDMKAFAPPEVIDGLCINSLVVVKDQFPVFPGVRPRALHNYRNYLFDIFGLSKSSESAMDHKFDIPSAALVQSPHSNAAGKPRVVLLHRNKHRCILNSEQLLSDLRSSLGDSAEIVEVALNQLNFKQQIELMQSTTVLIGAHGSGLAQLWFLPRTSSVIIIHPPGADGLLTPNGLTNGAPWLVDYESVATKLKLNAFTHKVTKRAQSLEDCGEMHSRWDIYCAYVKDIEVDAEELGPLVRRALDEAAKRRNEA